jgi:sec-independent protein translocase protein TatA
MLGNIRWPELLLVLVIVLLVFGVGRISKIAGELGSGIRAFKDGLSGDEKAKTSKDAEPSDKTDD